MASLSEHHEKIQAAIKAAEADGFTVEFEVDWDHYTSDVLTEIRLDIVEYDSRGKVKDWMGIITDDRS